MIGHNNQSQRVGYTIPTIQLNNQSNNMQQNAQIQQTPYAQNIATMMNVQGELEAKVWPVGNNGTAVLFDTDGVHLYVKTSTAFYKFVIDDSPTDQNYGNIDLSSYVKVEDVQQMINDSLTNFKSEIESEIRKPINVNQQNKKNYNKNRGGHRYDN